MNKKTDVIPRDSRYIPLTQQPACCVPTCFQMVMLRNKIPMHPAEEIGYYLGLVVHPDRKDLFFNARVSEQRPKAGYGTQIYKEEFDPNICFEKLDIPLSFSKKNIDQYKNANELENFLNNAEEDDLDILLCFNHGVLENDPEKMYGHVCVFDRMIKGKIRIVDPSPSRPKWRLVEVEDMFNAMKAHGDHRAAGCWILSKKD